MEDAGDVGGGDGPQAADVLVDRDDVVALHEAATEAGHAAAAVLEPEQHRPLEVAGGDGELVGVDAVGQHLGEDVVDHAQRLAGPLGGGAAVDGEVPGVGEG